MGVFLFSEKKTEIISLNSIKKLIFVMERRCVFSEVGAELLNNI
jgi:hypothetical protein